MFLVELISHKLVFGGLVLLLFLGMLEKGAGENVTHLGEILLHVGFSNPLCFLGDVLLVEDHLAVLPFQGLLWAEKFQGNISELLEVSLLDIEGCADSM